jgi:RNA polymerase sigma-70 factor (ECF subfamily)
MHEASEAGSFAAIYEQHAKGVYSTAFRVLGRAADAEDVTQDVFLRLWQSPGVFDPRRSPIGAFLRLMARSRALDVWRQGQAAGRARDRLGERSKRDDVRREERPDEAAELDELRRSVRAALRRLPPEQREALVLAYWGGLTGRELADRSGLPFGTARSRVRLAIEKLRAEPGLAGEREAA